MYYEDDDMLMLSGIQHYMYCPRQWALIHVEVFWVFTSGCSTVIYAMLSKLKGTKKCNREEGQI